MLVLSRKVGEEIIIGDNIRVRVLSIQGNQVRLGFVAPRSVAIQREELLAAVMKQPEKPATGRGSSQGEPSMPAPDAVVVAEPVGV